MADEKISEVDQARKELEKTRESLAKKLDTLEHRVSDVISETSESIDTAKHAVEDTVHSVEEGVKGTIKSFHEFLDLEKQAHRHPWAILGGSIIAGFIASRVFHHPAARRAVSSAVATASGIHATARQAGQQVMQPAVAEQPSIIASLVSQVEPELSKIRNIALAAAIGGLHEYVSPKIPENVKPQVNQIVDDITHRLTGESPSDTGSDSTNGAYANGVSPTKQHGRFSSGSSRVAG